MEEQAGGDPGGRPAAVDAPGPVPPAARRHKVQQVPAGRHSDLHHGLGKDPSDEAGGQCGRNGEMIEVRSRMGL